MVALALIAAISIWVPFLENMIFERWFSLPNFYFLSQVPLATLITGLLLWRYTGRRKRHVPPFVSRSTATKSGACSSMSGRQPTASDKSA